MGDEKPIWLSDSFIAQFADKYIAGTSLEAGHIANSIGFIQNVTARLIKIFERDGVHRSLPTFDSHAFTALKEAVSDLVNCHSLATARPNEPEEVVKLIQDVTTSISNAPVGSHTFVPGGWVGLTDGNALMHIVEKTSPTSCAFITCNSSHCNYHPSRPDRDKIKYRTSIRLDDVPLHKMLDPIFWSIMLSLWLKEPSEYHKGQIIYDVLLPWLADSLLPTALAKTAKDPYAEWRTIKRSGTGFYGAVTEALRYSLRFRGLTQEQMKQFTYAFRREILNKVREDLCVLSDPEGSLQDGLALGFGPAPQPDGVGALNEQAQLLLMTKNYVCNNGETVHGRSLHNTTFGLFFSGSWCDPCRRFMPMLAFAQKTIRERGQDFAIVFVSRCKSEDEFNEYFATMPSDWLAVPYTTAADRREELTRIFGVRGIPSLVIINNGQVMTMDGVTAVRTDPDCQGFPWTPAALAAAKAAQGPPSLEPHAAMLIRWACENVAAKAIKEQTAQRLELGALRELQNQIQRIRYMCSEMAGGKVFDDTTYIAKFLQERLDVADTATPEPFPRFELLACTDKVEKYAGEILQPSNPKPIDLVSLPKRVNSAEEALEALTQYTATCDALLARARDTSTTSRLVLQYEVLVILNELFTQVLPQPKGFYSFADPQLREDDIWARALPCQLQMDLLHRIYKLALVYGTMWQAIEVSPRASDCDRTVVAACMFTLFDAIVRRPASDVPMALSVMLSESSGYKLSSTVCQANVDFMDVAAKLELIQPHLVHAREGALTYLRAMNSVCKQEIFTFRQPDQIEVKKYGSTLLFLRSMLSRLGYELIPRNAQRQPPEIEMLVEWMIGENTTLAQEHPEWALTRDMVVIFKFLATMDSREAELMRRRKMKQQFLWWQLSFEEGGRRGWWGRLGGKPLSWEAVNFRGADLDTADIEVRGFGDRKLIFGEGPAVHSPADVTRMLNLEYPSEDDVLHCDRLPMFGNTLSREESEQLMSYLTVDYMRVPLVLGFFASKDRVTYLFNGQLQALLRAVLFEGRQWVPHDSKRPINNVPLRFTKQQAEEEKLQQLLGSRRGPEQEELGTHLGLLYNELLMSPQACLEPLCDMLLGTRPLHHASVYSRDASFLCYIILLAVDAEAYLLHVREDLRQDRTSRPFKSKQDALTQLDGYADRLHTFLRKDMAAVLRAWEKETDDLGDIVTSCVVMSYRCMLYANRTQETMTDDDLVQYLSSFLYVRNWHGFGLGLLASQMDSGELEEGVHLTPEDRLVRFLQAHGIDTSRVKKSDLSKYLKGKPLYLYVGGQTVRAPTLFPENYKGSTRIPPADVPEHRLFAVYSRQRSFICDRFGQYFASKSIDTILKKVLRIALRSPQFSDKDWSAMGPGRYLSSTSELKLDLQTGEVLWRNDDLQPVPDSVAQFADYQALFRDKTLHCGIVARQTHRYWIHLVGTEYDLIEWDEPKAEDQGISCPRPLPKTEEEEAQAPPMREAIARQLSAQGFDFDYCMRLLEGLNDDREKAERWLQTHAAAGHHMPPLPFAAFGRAGHEVAVKIDFDKCCLYQGQVWNRVLDIYDERPHCGLEHSHEHWIADVLQPILLANFPSFPPDRKLPYSLLLPEQALPKDCTVARLIACSAPDKEHATWKEIVVYKDRKLVHMYNLVSHGRKMYRVLIYTSHHGFSLAALSPNFDPKARAVPPIACKQAGNIRQQRGNDASLIVQRRNASLEGHEVLLPKRLLAGLIPDALLSSHRFYHGEDGVIRGEPLAPDEDTEWFGFRLDVMIQENGKAVVRKLPLSHEAAPVTARSEGANLLVRSSSASQPSAVVTGDAAEYDEHALLHLAALNFSIPAAKLALRTMGHDVDRAAQWLLDPDHKENIEEEEAKCQDSIDTSITHRLIQLGYSEAESRFASTNAETLEGCLEWLSHEENRQQALEAAQQPATLPSRQNSAMHMSVDSDVGTGEETGQGAVAVATGPTGMLLNLLDASKGSFLYRLATLLVRIEDLSHVLVWSDTVDTSAQACPISMIELPRLKLRMKPTMQRGELRLILLDHAGWYVSDIFDGSADQAGGENENETDGDEFAMQVQEDVTQESNATNVKYKYLKQLIQGIEHSWLLENGTGGFMLLMPNHDLYRLPLEGEPFPTQIMADRSSIGWQTTMDTRYYLYPIHQSHQHLICTTLASTLYLILIRFLTRNYMDAFQLIGTVFTDTEFDSEESWIFDQYERTLSDRHPEAHACRIKLALAIMYSDNSFKWDLSTELVEYLAKKPGVRAGCRLRPDEEFAALTLAKNLNQHLKNRFLLLKPRHNRLLSPDAKQDPTVHARSTDESTVQLKPDPMRWGGLPWAKVQTLTLDYIVRATQPLTRIHYKHPGVEQGKLDTNEILALIWDETLVADEESGSNRQLGIVFLYNLVRGVIRCQFSGSDVTDSTSTLLTRLFQLKVARWGEGTREGETEYVITKQMAMLGCMLTSPDAMWPPVPDDPSSQRLLSRGLNLYSPEGRMTDLKQWLDMADMVFRGVMTDPMKNILISSQIEEFSAVRKAEEAEARLASTHQLTDLAQQPLRLGDNAMTSRSLRPFRLEANGDADDDEDDDEGSSGTPLRLDAETVEEFATQPLRALVGDLVTWEPTSDPARTQTPFDLKSHPAAAAAVSRELLERLDEDVARFAHQHNTQQVPILRGLTYAELSAVLSAASSSNKEAALDTSAWSRILSAVDEPLSKVATLVGNLRALYQSDMAFVERSFAYLDSKANAVVFQRDDELQRRLFDLRKFVGQRPRITTQFVISALMSSSGCEDLKRGNPYLEDTSSLMGLAAAAALHTNRASFIKTVLSQAEALLTHLETLRDALRLHENGPGLDAKLLADRLKRIDQEQRHVATSLTSARHYVKREQGQGDDKPCHWYDPRFLVGEYMFEILLRQRQVEIVREMAASANAHASKVQQMIMGAGKTTVVGPMLSLILADGDSLVVQIMPSALLEQTRNVLRSRFSFVAVKRIFTLNFDRSIDDLEKIHSLFSKIEAARVNRDILCAAPEAVKSLMLKSIEALERLDSFDFNTIRPNESYRNNREVSRLRDQLASRSDIADSVFRVLDIIKNKGILIMDEVDVILNPLKSELNFPIGATTAMPSYRWDLPMHIIDAFFHREEGELCEHFKHPSNPLNIQPEAVVAELAAVIERGVTEGALQKEPHIVLLSQPFYWEHMRPVIARWCYLWLVQAWDNKSATVDPNHIMTYLLEGNTCAADVQQALEIALSRESLRFLNLASEWTRTLFSHCISKINRVSYGLLRPNDLARLDPRAPQSRRLMAVPFVGKDVPSRSSEFAHPDVLIGLTVLAYRYEGLRASDLKRMVIQLKQDLSRQVGPRDKRPASVLFQSWLDVRQRQAESKPRLAEALDSVLPLPLFQPNDNSQMNRLHSVLKRLPHSCFYYLRQHVFPSTMRAQALKISASGVDLGSSIVFGRARLGFSGTPNNLMPAELGKCEYEPGSDGKVIHVLTSSEVTTASIKSNWTAKSLLRDVAEAQPPFHALIDTGALITGFSNLQAARYLLKHLPESFEGVVYLDRLDRQMILLRNSGRCLPLSQCGVKPEHRFTFYDQIHTTGMDIKQAPNARAVLTIGKDMTFRDYAQGAFRMRGIGQGQTIHLYIISEVMQLLHQELESASNRPELDIPAWLLVNSMNAASMQYCKLGMQEIQNVWRKSALSALQQEALLADAPGVVRMRRFMSSDEQTLWLKNCVDKFREKIGFPLPDHIPHTQVFGDKLRGLQADNERFAQDEASKSAVRLIIERIEEVSAAHIAKTEGGLDSEVVHENEAEAEEEAEEEAEQEEEKMSAYTRDDEQQNPWNVEVLARTPSLQLGGEEPFYRFQNFRVRDEQPTLVFPEDLLLTDNFFRPRWVGIGDRRLKNIAVVMEWQPGASRLAVKQEITRQFKLLVQQGEAPNKAAAAATAAAMLKLKDVVSMVNTQGLTAADTCYFVALSLAEAETVRRILHSQQAILKITSLALWTLEGRNLDASHLYDMLVEARGPRGVKQRQEALVCYRFVNNDMFYSDEEITILLEALSKSLVIDREKFFDECLRLRRRERNRWADTPLAKVLTEEASWHLLSARAKLDQFNAALQAKPSIDFLAACSRYDEDQDGKLSCAEVQRCLESLHLGFSPRDVADIISVIDGEHQGYLTLEQLASRFYISPRSLAGESEKEGGPGEGEETAWQCQNCTFVNSLDDKTCAMCELGWTGQRECPTGKWTCDGCTFFNPDALFYCDMCGKVRPNLEFVRF
eukprot:m.58502 g.58502  ORF g.58502 m.58502 type:complete len:4257 (-) comp13155_c0_seq1:39-12809(-)